MNGTMKMIKTVIAVVTLLVILLGCSGTSIKHVSAEDFLKKAKQIEQMNSATWTTYIGSTENRAYLEYADVIAIGQKKRTIVYWTEIDNLPKDIADKLRRGISPWKPWQNGAKKEES